MTSIRTLTWRIAAAFLLGLAAAGAAQAQVTYTIGTTFPAGFTAPNDASLGKPVIGFGGALPATGALTHTPVVFLHGNGGTPYYDATTCADKSPDIRGMAQYFADNGYDLSELWALGYQGAQCDVDPTSGFLLPAYRSSIDHTHAANVVDLQNFVNAVLSYTRARHVDIVAHGMGVTLVREWYRQYGNNQVRRFVAIDGPNSGMIICSANPQNPWQLGLLGGFTPTSPLCQELGSPNTQFLKVLNGARTRIDPKTTLVIRNGANSCPSFLFTPDVPDGQLMPVVPSPVVDSLGKRADFSSSARIRSVQDIVLCGQSAWDPYSGRGSAHIGIANSPDTLAAAFEFLTR